MMIAFSGFFTRTIYLVKPSSVIIVEYALRMWLIYKSVEKNIVIFGISKKHLLLLDIRELVLKTPNHLPGLH
ncbi:MAG TPA: hypothetical protein VJG49_00980 [Candidatus Nanoarchaeia archaeon]|nr:hypothetical protein [Candidatus Nanoarchaeia archaeon]